MRFGLSFLPDCPPGERSAADYFREAVTLSRIAEAGGMHSIKITQHYLHPYGGYCPSPLAFLSFVAAQTQHIRLMTGCLLAGFHHPLKLAAEAAMVDVMSGGRLDLGLARAFLPYEFDAFGVPMNESRQRFEETIRAVRALWLSDGPVSEATPFFSYSNVRSLPAPVQRPHPPIWGAAVRARESFAWIGEQGFGLLSVLTGIGPELLAQDIALYRECHQDAHGNRGRVVVSIPIYVAERHQDALEEGSAHLDRYHAVWGDALGDWDRVQSSAYPGYTGMARAIRSASANAMIANRSVLFGDPIAVAEGTAALAETLDVDEIIWNIDFGAMPLERSRRSLNLFLDRVWPRLGESERGAAANPRP